MPTLYITTRVRSGNYASKTLERHLRAIMHLYTWAMIDSIDVEIRLAQCEILNLHEIDSLVRACRSSYDVLVQTQNAPLKRQPRIGKVVSYEGARASAPKKTDEVAGPTAANRIRAIRDYLDWLMCASYNRTSKKSGSFDNFETARLYMRDAFTARLPINRGRAEQGNREGLSSDELDLLLQVLNPEDLKNPWSDKSLALRNQVIFLMLYTLGIRRGEVLGLKISNINFRNLEVSIHRRADDPDDPRVDQPNAKTKDRILHLEPPVADMIHDYIIKHRIRIPGAKQNPFLFVTHKPGPYQGRPLSTAGYSKMIETLRKRVPTLPDDLSGHSLRHSWNDYFSKFVDQKRLEGNNITAEREQQMRSYLMGWSEDSSTAATYTRRHVREASKKISLEMQKRFIMEQGNES
ncbi:Phage integrase family protein [Puniceibacterium sediminis]|uniref:Phage integrase family protein n=2 Tax=Puniceibacterium sediminis TaxID=1608407 RepID=A0A238VZT6_9RHOB|nr:Phage integrase family protein [Puniceibacterium sediminis]